MCLSRLESVLKLSNQHKALLLTFLTVGTVILAVFSFSLKKQNEKLAESYYLLEPEKELTEEEIKTLENLKDVTKAETNKAFNETQKNKHFAQAYKPIAPPEDFVPKHNTINSEEAINNYKEKYKGSNNSKLKNEDLSSYSKVSDLIQKQQANSVNNKTTMSYSLVNRTMYSDDTPVYLCEKGGRIVVNITVNSSGDVIETYVNSSSTSSNACLIKHALEYAEQARFNPDASKKTQLGSITFNFIGKH